MSEATKGLLRGNYGDKGIPQAFISVVHGMIAAGRDLDEIRDFFRTRHVALAKAVRLHYLSNLDDELETAYLAAITFRGDHSTACGHARGVVADLWRGADGTAFRTLMGLYDIAEIAGGFEFTASRRQVAEASGLGGLSNNQASYVTAAKAVNRLHEAGLICFDARGHRRGERDAKSVYRLLSLERLQDALLSGSCTPIPFTSAPGDAVEHAFVTAPLCSPKQKTRGIEPAHLIPLQSTWQHPLWEPAGLGVTSCRVWHRLDEAASAKRVAEFTGISKRSINEALRRLADYGLSRQSDGIHSRTLLDLDEVAAQLGVVDRPTRRAEFNNLHRSQRETYLNRPRPNETADTCPIIDPFTGEIFHVATFDAATLLLGGLIARQSVAA